ncbi:MAG: hypothetical protein IKJ56_03710 [Bacteroidales bacterium]|nr:hypothetical protein [Bacteroidales bacterium]
MIAFIIVLLIAIFFLLGISKAKRKKEKKADPVSALKLDVSVSTNSIEDETYNEPIKQVANGWVINPRCPFELTVMNCDFETASLIRRMCDERGWKAEHELLALFATQNIRIKEIEAYKKKYAPLYFQRIEELKATSKEYLDAEQKDKSDMLEEFRVTAQDCLYELPDYDVYNLFVEDNVTIDDDLLQRYGFDCLEAYLKYYGKIGSVVTVNKDAYYRPAFEKMAEKGMAIRGKDIPTTEILSVQNLKTLNAIASNPDKEFKRKNQAVEYILNDEKAVSRIGEYVSFRELFKLLPLPHEYDALDIDAILRVWESHRVEIELLIRTYKESVYQWERYHEDSDIRKRIFKTCKVECTNDRCQCAKDRMKRTYSIDNLPKTPCHIGCSCWLEYE